ncbi:major facilitator superfamily domain-containing protein [Xylaria sp. FL1777]|nr:major facilitator superfamily domain-containing protein [Xylaria sp. FL1777]
MSNTELVTIRLPNSATPSSPSEGYERSSPSLRPQDVEGDRTNPTRAEQELAPVDGGPAAWRLLAAAFIFEALLWGFPLSFGVFQEYYSKIPEFANNRYVSVVGTIASGFGYLGAPVVIPILQRYQRWWRQMVCIGWSICIAGLVLGSFASTLELLILTQGVAYGIGFLIFYYPILGMVNEYWITRRGMAYGILCGASGVSGSVMPFVLQALLAQYGYKTTLRAVAVALVFLTGPFIPLLKGRLPPPERANIPKMNWTFFQNSLFWVYSVANLLQGLGYFFPSLYLPSYASSLGLGGKSGALLLAVMSICQVGGQFVFGLLSDRKVPLTVLACSSTIVAAVACLTLWRLAKSLPVLVIFVIIYGFFGAGFTATWARMSTSVTNDVTAGPIVFSLLNFGKGIGNVLAGPIGGSLISISQSPGTPSSLSYSWVIVFAGVSMFASAFTICLRYLNISALWSLNENATVINSLTDTNRLSRTRTC